MEGVVTESLVWFEPPKGTTSEDKLREAFQPEGAKVDRETLPEKPLTDVTVIFVLPKDPFWMAIEEGEVEIVEVRPDSSCIVPSYWTA